jgi:hypothetical protein
MWSLFQCGSTTSISKAVVVVVVVVVYTMVITRAICVFHYVFMSLPTIFSITLHCRVYANVQHRLTDHRLLVLSLQLSFKVQQCDAPRRGLWDGEALYVPKVKAAFEGVVSNCFSTLNPKVSNLKDEWHKWVHKIYVATLEKVGVHKM